MQAHDPKELMRAVQQDSFNCAGGDAEAAHGGESPDGRFGEADSCVATLLKHIHIYIYDFNITVRSCEQKKCKRHSTRQERAAAQERAVADVQMLGAKIKELEGHLKNAKLDSTIGCVL